MFFIIIRTKQPARCPEVGDVFGVNAVSPYDQRYHIQTLETLTKGTRISLFWWIHLCLSSVCVKIRILMRFPIWCVSYNTKKSLDVQLVSCFTIFWYRTHSQVRMVQDVHCHPVLWRIVQVCHPPPPPKMNDPWAWGSWNSQFVLPHLQMQMQHTKLSKLLEWESRDIQRLVLAFKDPWHPVTSTFHGSTS